MSRFDYRDFLRSPDGRLASGPPLLNTEGLQYLVGNDGRNAIDQLGNVVPVPDVSFSFADFTVVAPAGGLVREFDSVADMIWKTFDLLATLVLDAQSSFGVYTITGDLTTVFNPNTAMNEDAMAFCAKLASEVGGRLSVYSVTQPAGGWLYSFNPNTDPVEKMFDFLATFAHEASMALCGNYVITPFGTQTIAQSATATNVISSIKCRDIRVPYIGDADSRPHYKDTDWECVHSGGTGGKWTLTSTSLSIDIDVVSDSMIPPKAFGAEIISWGSLWYNDSGDRIVRDYDNYKSATNGTKDEACRWKKVDGICVVDSEIIYKQGTIGG